MPLAALSLGVCRGGGAVVACAAWLVVAPGLDSGCLALGPELGLTFGLTPGLAFDPVPGLVLGPPGVLRFGAWPGLALPVAVRLGCSAESLSGAGFLDGVRGAAAAASRRCGGAGLLPAAPLPAAWRVWDGLRRAEAEMPGAWLVLTGRAGKESVLRGLASLGGVMMMRRSERGGWRGISPDACRD